MIFKRRKNVSYPIFIYDAFTKEKFGGNAAGIVLDAENLSTVEKQNLAKELGFSETVFVQRNQSRNIICFFGKKRSCIMFRLDGAG